MIRLSRISLVEPSTHVKESEIKGQESIRGNASRSALPGRGGNNLSRNSIIGPLISFTAKRLSALCQGRVLARAREGAVHSGAPPARDGRMPEIEPRRNVEDSQHRFWDIVDKAVSFSL